MDDVIGVIFPADYKKTNLGEIIEEVEGNTVLDWKCNLNYVKTGTKVLIYYFNLPDKVSKILYMCTAISTKENGRVKLKISKIVDVDNINMFSKDVLKTYDISTRNQFYLKKSNKKHVNFLEYFEENTKRKTDYNFMVLEKKVFECDCFFKGTKFDGKNVHPTFKRENGYDFFNSHHFIQRKDCKIIGWTSEKQISNFDNKVNLCVLCHNRIHNGTKKDIEFMVREIWKEKENVLKENINEIEKKDILTEEWILKTYGIEK